MATETGQGVLTPEHLTKINEGLASLNEADRQIKLATAAGINVGDSAQKVAETRDQLLRIKNVYFPNQ